MSTRLVKPVSSQDHTQGRLDAPLTLLEYGDYECPSCGAAYWVVKAIQRHLGAGLRFVFRNFPLSELHPHALMAAEAAEAAAAQGKFWEMHDLLFENQRKLGRGHLLRYAQSSVPDLQRWTLDFTSHAHMPRVLADLRGGVQSGVSGTPCFFIDGVRYEGGLDERSLLTALEAALEARRQHLPTGALP
jgi:protein-disulfide isomerase